MLVEGETLLIDPSSPRHADPDVAFYSHAAQDHF